jgi:hypothetical protein
MKQKLIRNPLVFAIVLLSFAWNVFLLIGVVLNLGFVHTRAAGGQFTDFPTGIRVAYVLQLALVAYQVWIFKLIFHSDPVKPSWTPKLFFTLGILGILANAASRSANERWNVIPAAIITWSFWYYGIKRDMKSL